MRSPTDGLTVGQALALGALHGPTELLPVSSSAHTSAIPWLLGWRYAELEPELQKSFEVALHAGTTIALLLTRRSELRQLRRQRLILIGLAAVPPAIAGYAFEHQIERRLGTPKTIAAALLTGAMAMALADRRPQDRSTADARPHDGLWLGLAQAAALVPGISRAGATLSAARFLRFRAPDAQLLSDETALPVLAGAGLLKAIRLRRRGLDSRAALTLAVGAGAALVSTLACAAPARRSGLLDRLSPYAAYRGALAGAMLARLWRDSTTRRSGRALP